VKRSRIGLAVAVIGLAGLMGLAGCARLADRAGAAAQAPAEQSPEALALAAMGFDAGLEPAGAPSADPSPNASPNANSGPGHPGKGRRALRVQLRKNVLHGEAVVQTKNGVQTIEVQRGRITAVTGTTVTVASTDGFTETWTFGDPFRVVQNRAKVAASAIKAGAQIGIAGIKSGDTVTARLAVLPQ
jgi:hypothetical protein